MDLALLVLAASATALATGLGAVPVFLLGPRAAVLRPALWGLAAGLMGVASVVGLLLPALREGSLWPVGAGLATGLLFMLGTRRALGAHDVQVHGLRGAGVRRSVLVFAVLFVHSLPEGLAMGAAYATDTAGLALFVILAIALQNIPEGTSVAIPMEAAGFGRGEQFWAAVLTSAPQPLAAPLAYLLVERIETLLPFSFAFAAGAMLALVAYELVPQAFTRRSWRSAAAGTLTGGLLMVGLSAILEVGPLGGFLRIEQ